MPKNKPFFSIIIPALNEAKYLPKLLGDLAGQTFRDFEVIVVDGNSNDTTVVKAKSFIKSLPRLTVIAPPPRHVCVQRNLGAKQAKADIFVFMDSDNRLPPYFLQGVKYRFESEYPDIANFWIKPDISSPSADLVSLGINLGTEIQNNIKPRFMLESLICVTKQAFHTLHGFDESINYAEGVDFISAAHEHHHTIKTFRDPIYYYSFRRFRKFGTLTVLHHTTQLGISQLFDQDYKNIKASTLYPMLGGSVFTRNKRIKNQFLKSIAQLFKEF